MMYGQDRSQLRDVFFKAWRRHRANEPLEGVERVIVAVAERHPEYQPYLENPDAHAERDFHAALGETNPFMHLALHLAIEEQLAIDQPMGIRGLYRDLLAHLPDEHAVQHAIMECLGETLWRAQHQGTPPSDAVYLECIARSGKQPDR